jgi:protein-S-isoprenylcysteine O-methyltransferase Ste14
MRRFTERGGWWVAAQLVLLGLLGTALMVWTADWGPAATGGGWAVAAAGGGLAATGLAALGGNLTPYPSPGSDAHLVERGPYRLVRHPVYGGIVIGAAGISVVVGSIAGLSVTVGLVILFLGKSGFEEERLLRRFPAYAGYRNRVTRRLVPWVL